MPDVAKRLLSLAVSTTLLVGALITTLPGVAAAGPADLDTDFGTAGRAVVNFPTAAAQANSVNVRPDGRIVLGGYVSRGSPNIEFGSTRLNVDGSLDTGFGGNGLSEADMGGSDFARASALQKDGKIVLAGSTTAAGGAFAIARTSATGFFDTSFSGDGKAYVDFPGSGSGALAMDLQDDGKIVVVGGTSQTPTDSTSEDFAIARLSPNGTLDTTFNSTGKARIGFGGNDAARSVAVQDDGKIVVGGRTSANSGEMVLARLLPGGAVDSTFGTNGRVLTGFKSGGTDTGASDIALLPDGKILAVGADTGASDTSFSIVRLNEDGTFDTTFGTNGKVWVDFPMDFHGTPISIAIAHRVAVQQNGKIVVGGYRLNPMADFSPTAALTRLHANGTVDGSFGDSGRAVISPCREVTDLALQTDGKILVSGSTCSSGMTVYRLNGDHVEAPPFAPNEAPHALFYHSPQPPKVGQKITFTDISSDADGDIVQVEWDLDGDGQFDDATGPQVTHTFGSAGTKMVGVRVTDDDGDADSMQTDVTVVALPQNTVRPKITKSVGVLGNIFYCSEGEWTDLPADPQFTFTWWRGTRDIRQFSGYRWSQVGTGDSYKLKDSDVGGTFVCEVKVSNAHGEGKADSAYVVLTKLEDPFPRGLPYGNFRTRGIDVFQVTQPNSDARMFGYPDGRFPAYCGGGTPAAWFLLFCQQQGSAQQLLYEGTHLDVLKKTFAIVYVDMEGAQARDPNRQLEVVLTPRVDGKLLSNQALTRTIMNPPVSTTPWVTRHERSHTGFGVEFQVPQAWMGLGSFGRLDLHARVRFPTSTWMELRTPYQCDDPNRNCAADDTFRLDDLLIYRAPPLQIETLALQSKDTQSFPTGEKVLRKAVQLFPGGERWTFPEIRTIMDIRPLMGLTLDSDECEAIKAQKLRSCHSHWISHNLLGYKPQASSDIVMAIHDYRTSDGRTVNDDPNFIEPGWKIGRTGTIENLTDTSPGRLRPTLTANMGTSDRPLTAAAHEMGHAFGSPHAGQACEDTGPGQSQEGEWWRFDDQGRLQGLKFDITSRRSDGTNRLIPRIDGATTVNGHDVEEPPLMLFDMMSYCSGEARAWISPRNWNRWFQGVRGYGERFGTLRAEGAETQQEISGTQNRKVAIGIVAPGAGMITRLLPASHAPKPPDAGESPLYKLRALGPDDELLEEVGVAVLNTSESSLPEEGSFSGSIPAEAVAVELLHDTQVVDRIEVSAPPAVSVTAPKKGALVKGDGNLVVRWNSSDADDDTLFASVDFSSNGGKSWRTIHEGPDSGQAKVPGSSLAKTKKARVRVRLNDGFTQVQALSPLFETQGTKPNATIITPSRGEPLRPLEKTLLSGFALDDAGKNLRGRRLTWLVGTKKLGTGEQLRARLPVGKRTLKLVAKDGHGRKGVASLTVRVRPLPLQVTFLKGPQRVKKGATAYKLKIAASGPALLRAGGKKFSVGKKTTEVTIPLPRRPKTGLLEIPYELTPREPTHKGRIKAKIAFIRA